jgi:hypothetical protein
MIDPVSVGVAFAAAQGAVEGIKSAINLGKDINEIMGDLGKFLRYSDEVYTAANKSNIQNYKKSDAELGELALQLAMSAKKLREDEKMLKDLLYWSGNAQVWEDMKKEHIRLIKEKREFERQQREIRAKRNEEIAELILGGAVAIVGLLAIIFTFMAIFNLSTR